MAERTKGNKMSITTFVTPETYYAIEESRGILKRSTFCGMVLEDIFNPREVKTYAQSRCN